MGFLEQGRGLLQPATDGGQTLGQRGAVAGRQIGQVRAGAGVGLVRQPAADLRQVCQEQIEPE